MAATTVTPNPSFITVTEGGGTATISVTLDEEPEPQCSLSGSTLGLKTQDSSLESPFPAEGDLHTVNVQMTGSLFFDARLEAGVAFVYKSPP